MIYNSLILPNLNYSSLSWGTQCPNIELLQKKAVRASCQFKSPVAHTEPILRNKSIQTFTCQLPKLHYKLYRNKLPAYFKNFLPMYGDTQHNLRNNYIRLPAIRCEFGKLNTKCTSGYESWLNYLIHHCTLTLTLIMM